MKKWQLSGLAVIAILLTTNDVIAQEAKLLQHRSYPSYSSSSGIEWHKGRMYVMGDDAPDLLIVNKKLREQKRISVFDRKEKRIASAEKADFESAFLWKEKGRNYIVFLPSFSTPVRNRMLILPLKNLKPQLQATTPGNHQLKEINIEGATRMGPYLLLANRNLDSTAKHEILVYDFDLKKGLSKTPRRIALSIPQAKQVGISGLAYLRHQDILLITLSSEATGSATADGAIGNSFLGIVYNAGRQFEEGNMNVEKIINLTPILKTNQPQKIEAITVEAVKRKTAILHLASDNDNGSSELFTVSVDLRR